MPFTGTELLEVTGTKVATVWGGGNWVLAVDRWDSASATFSVMNATTGTAHLYTVGGAMGADGFADYNDSLGLFAVASGYVVAFFDPATGSSTRVGVSWSPNNGIMLTDTHAVVLVSPGYQYAQWGTNYYTLRTIDLSTMGYADLNSLYLRAIGRHGNNIYVVNDSQQVLPFDPTTRTYGSPLATLPEISGGPGTQDGDWIWWPVNSQTIPIVGYNTATGETRARNLTPSALTTNYANWTRLAIDSNHVAYRINSDGQSMTAINLNTGQYLEDELAVVRTGRRGIGFAKGKLWIPSNVTPP